MLNEFEDDVEELKVVPSEAPGVFEVFLNDELIFSKKELSRHPEKDEVEDIIKDKIKN